MYSQLLLCPNYQEAYFSNPLIDLKRDVFAKTVNDINYLRKKFHLRFLTISEYVPNYLSSTLLENALS